MKRHWMSTCVQTFGIGCVFISFCSFANIDREGDIAPPLQTKDFGHNFIEENNINPTIKSLTSDLFGDTLDLSTGNLAFSHDDLSIPGNFDIPVGIIRKLSDPDSWHRETLEFGNWSLSLPHIRSTYILDKNGNADQAYWNRGKACTLPLNSNPNYNVYIGGGANQSSQPYVVSKKAYWNGDTVSIPQQGSVKLTTKKGDSTYQRYNNKNWKVECFSGEDGNEGFKITTNNGLTYFLEKERRIKSFRKYTAASVSTGQTCTTNCAPVTLPSNTGYIDPKLLFDQISIFLLPSKIIDRFDNEVRFTYGENGLIEQISTSDGRHISFVSSQGRIAEIRANGKVWHYNYQGNEKTYLLESVTRPDGKSWHFDYSDWSEDTVFGDIYNDGHIDWGVPGTRCLADRIDRPYLLMAHPDGVVGNFKVVEHCHNQSEVPKLRRIDYNQSGPAIETYHIQPFSRLFSLSKKSLTLNDGSSYEWQYEYSASKWAFKNDPLTEHHRLNGALDGVETAHLKSTKVIQPDGSETVSYFDRRYASAGNKLHEELFDSFGVLRERHNYTYINGPDHGDNGLEAFINGASQDPLSAEDARTTNPHNQLITKQVVYTFSEAGAFQDSYTKKWYEFNVYDEPERFEESNSFSNNKRFIKNGFHHDLLNHVLNLPTFLDVSTNGNDWQRYSLKTYHTAVGPYKTQLKDTYSVRKLISTNSEYHTDGNLKKTRYTDTNRYEIFENYYRGKARKITMPCGTVNGCNNANGSSTNTIIANLKINDDGTTASVTDFIGNTVEYRYNSIGWLTDIIPADTQWAPTSIDYQRVTSHGDGQGFSPVFAGDTKQVITTGTHIKVNYLDGLLRPVFTKETEGVTSRYVRTEYDYKNQPTFQSWPYRTSVTPHGTSTEYDYHGRAIEVVRTADKAKTNTTILAGNRAATTDPLGNTTTSTYLAYGSPNHKYPIKIEDPIGGITSLSYNALGQVTQISQGGFTEERHYDQYAQLCRIKRPDTGITEFGHNAQRQLAWKANGLVSPSSICGVSLPSRRATMSYDNLGRLAAEKHPDDSQPRAYHYDENNNLTSLTTSDTQWSYQYNSRNLLEVESLTISGLEYPLSWAYNSRGHTKSVTYPSGLVIDFTPNELGQPTQAGSYATDAIYHPTGSLGSFVYGNGVQFIQRFDATNRPEALEHFNNDDIVNLTYEYDLADNLIGLTDVVTSANSLSGFDYDGLHRLKKVNGKWGSATLKYDSIGNLYEKNVGQERLTLHFNTTTNRLDRVSGSVIANYQHDDAGNVTNNTLFGMSYNHANQMLSADGNLYYYDGHGKRVKVTNRSGESSHSVYSRDGKLMFKTDLETGKTTDYIYLADQLVAKIDDSAAILEMPESISVPSFNNNGSFTVSWAAGLGASHYTLQQQLNGGSWETISLNTTATSQSLSGKATGAYRYRVSSCHDNNCSDYRFSSTFYVVHTPSYIAYALQTTTGSAGITWKAVNGASSYKLEHKLNGAWALIYAGTATSFTASLADGDYQFRVRACRDNVCGDAHQGATLKARTLTAPSSLTSPSKDTDGNFSVLWSDEIGAYYYQLQQQLNDGAWADVTNTKAQSHNITGKQTGKYRYRVRSCDSNKCTDYQYSSYTYVVHTPSTISYVEQTSSGNATIFWSVVPGATGYRLENYLNGSWKQIYSGSGTSYKATLADGKSKFRVNACKDSSCGNYRLGIPWLTATTPFVAFTVSPTSVSRIGDDTRVSWSASGADYCKLSSNFRTYTVAASGSQWVTAFNYPYSEFSMTCYWGSISKSSNSSVRVLHNPIGRHLF
ncbi:RHS repeat protein [Ferrimonas lipolytica]|uniref:RHS repeat protein n=1 Tax=Ferrimonas lipolytica TaxID=2724191 RepID=A0A6H1UKD4_9GAMM|nr:RHS repeat protein [Ferrimonas lipolytica]QIZ78686.1 RHS repeat protein [Ferrimonas lipolytica]